MCSTYSEADQNYIFSNWYASDWFETDDKTTTKEYDLMTDGLGEAR